MIEARRFWVANPAQKQRVAEEIMHLQVSERDVAEVIIRPPRKEKTQSQRGYWHVVLDELGQQLGYTRGQMKEVVKKEYYGTDTIKLPAGQTYEIVESSEKEDRAGYGRLIDFTLQLANEQGFPIRDPRQTY